MDSIFASEESIVKVELPTKPSAPSAFTETAPASKEAVSFNGGAGYPISGQYELGPVEKGRSSTKYFGVLG